MMIVGCVGEVSVDNAAVASLNALFVLWQTHVFLTLFIILIMMMSTYPLKMVQNITAIIDRGWQGWIKREVRLAKVGFVGFYCIIVEIITFHKQKQQYIFIL